MEIIKSFVEIIVVIIAIFILWLVSEGHFTQAIDFLMKNPWQALIIIMFFIFILGLVTRARKN